MVAENHTTTQNSETIIQMFLDETAGEVYSHGRLATVPTENGVQLVAYGNEIIGEVEGKDVTIFTGHHGTVSNTVTRYIKRLGSELSDTEGRNVTVARHESPTLGIGARASHSAQYISEYFNVLKDSFSAVERNAKSEVNHALNERMSEIFN